MKRAVPGLLAFALVGGCSANLISHDAETAASAAVEFGTASFVQGDVERAYALLSDEARATVSREQLREVLANMHPAARPVSLAAIEYEPVPGQRAMQIFLRGQNGSEEFHYRLMMLGSMPAGYKVSGIFRGSGPYPPSKLRTKL